MPDKHIQTLHFLYKKGIRSIKKNLCLSSEYLINYLSYATLIIYYLQVNATNERMRQCKTANKPSPQMFTV